MYPAPVTKNWEDENMRRHLPYVTFTALLWVVVLPGVLVVDAGGVVWRHPIWVTLGAFAVAGGLTSMTIGARHLASAGIGLFGVRPGKVLVTDGPYAVVRNPVEIGVTLVAMGVWLVLGIPLAWVIPVAAAISFVGAYGPYEDRLLYEEFGEEFSDYRSGVRKWIPRQG
jgi:protein-S-isoprenylcysteine O-methyltransferase Ste14